MKWITEEKPPGGFLTKESALSLVNGSAKALRIGKYWYPVRIETKKTPESWVCVGQLIVNGHNRHRDLDIIWRDRYVGWIKDNALEGFETIWHSMMESYIIGLKNATVAARHSQWVAGYACCVASILNGHGRNTEVDEAFRGCRPEEYLAHADQLDIATFRRHGFKL